MFLSAQDNSTELGSANTTTFFFCIAFITVIGNGEIDVTNQWQGCLTLNKTNLFFKLKVSFQWAHWAVSFYMSLFHYSKQLQGQKGRLVFSETPLPQNWGAEFQAVTDRSSLLHLVVCRPMGHPKLHPLWILGIQTQALTHNNGS